MRGFEDEGQSRCVTGRLGTEFTPGFGKQPIDEGPPFPLFTISYWEDRLLPLWAPSKDDSGFRLGRVSHEKDRITVGLSVRWLYVLTVDVLVDILLVDEMFDFQSPTREGVCV